MFVDQTIPVQFIKASQLAYKPANCLYSLQFTVCWTPCSLKFHESLSKLLRLNHYLNEGIDKK